MILIRTDLWRKMHLCFARLACALNQAQRESQRAAGPDPDYFSRSTIPADTQPDMLC